MSVSIHPCCGQRAAKSGFLKTLIAIEYSVYKGLAIFSQPPALFEVLDDIIPFAPYIIWLQAIST